MTNETHYPVGYKNPPASGRFKKGQSGNPKGRPKKEDRLSWQVLEDILARNVRIKDETGVLEVPTWEAIMRQLVNKAVKGDSKAIKDVIQLRERISPPEAEKQAVDISILIDRLPN